MIPPFVELSLYFAEGSPLLHLLDAVDVLLQSGGKLEAFFTRGVGETRAAPFHCEDVQEVRRLVSSGQWVVSEVLVRNAIGLIAAPERISLLDPESTLRPPFGVKDNGDPSPVVIESSGTVFGAFPGEPDKKQRARSAGRKVTRRFRLVVSTLRPSYAAITVERPLATPHDSWITRNPCCFDNFYMSREFMGDVRFGEFLQVVRGATVEETEAGAYVWSSPTFGPSARLPREEMDRINRAVARLVQTAGA